MLTFVLSLSESRFVALSSQLTSLAVTRVNPPAVTLSYVLWFSLSRAAIMTNMMEIKRNMIARPIRVYFI